MSLGRGLGWEAGGHMSRHAGSSSLRRSKQPCSSCQQTKMHAYMQASMHTVASHLRADALLVEQVLREEALPAKVPA